jgi:hypothetical protein
VNYSSHLVWLVLWGKPSPSPVISTSSSYFYLKQLLYHQLVLESLFPEADVTLFQLINSSFEASDGPLAVFQLLLLLIQNAIVLLNLLCKFIIIDT